MNRIAVAIQAQRVNIQSRLANGLVTQDKIDALHGKLDMDLMEYCRFQEMKSVAMGSVLNPEEAQTIYGYLGNTVEHFNGQPVEVKAVLTQTFAELMKWSMRKAS